MSNETAYVYVLGNGSEVHYQTYVGWTTDLDRRLGQHNKGTGAKSTRGRQWSLLYAERYDTRSSAMHREWHLKRDKMFRALLRAHFHAQTENAAGKGEALAIARLPS